MSAFERGLVSLSLVGLLMLPGMGAASAQDLDQNKSATRLFASNCVACHHSARGLAKGRISWSLSAYLQQHYTSSPESAQALAAYLQSVDTPRAKPRPATASARSRPQATRASATDAVPRPPASVPRR
jgi:mono/diheme cytochrome c family protein